MTTSTSTNGYYNEQAPSVYIKGTFHAVMAILSFAVFAVLGKYADSLFHEP